MDEELKQILGEDSEKIEAIKKMVGEKFVPTNVMTERINKERDNAQKIQQASDALKKEYDEFKLSKMTEDEKAKELQTRANEENQKILKELNEYVARTIFSQNNIDEDDYENLLSTIVSTDKEKTRSMAEGICAIITKQKKDNLQQVKETVIKNQPKPEGGNDNTNGKTSKLEMYEAKLEKARKEHDSVSIATYMRLVQEEKNKK